MPVVLPTPAAPATAAIASAGLIHEETSGWVGRSVAYPVIAAIGVLLVWTTDVFSIITLSSRAFALFYALQCVVAGQVAMRESKVDNRRMRAIGFFALAVMAFAAAVFGLPVEGGE